MTPANKRMQLLAVAARRPQLMRSVGRDRPRSVHTQPLMEEPWT